MKAKYFVFLLLPILNGCANVEIGPSSSWKYHWSKKREPVDPNHVVIYYARSEVPFKYVEVATLQAKAHASKGKPPSIPQIKKYVGSLVDHAANDGAEGLIISINEGRRLPAICVADNANEEPLCSQITDLEAIAIAPKK